MESQLPLYFIVFPLLSAIVVAAIHVFIRGRLGEKHDSGLLWVSAALFFWFLIGVLEYRYSSYSADYLVLHYRETWPYWYGRKVLSVINSALFIYSLSYFREGWLRLHQRLEKINLGMMALITICLCFATLPLEPRIWNLTETVVSITVILLLCLSMAAIFYQRGMITMTFFTAMVCFFMVYTQVMELVRDPSFSNENISPLIDRNLVRLLSMPSLLICILALAISWLGVQLEEEVVARPVVRQSNSLRFETRGMRHYLTMSLTAEHISFQNLVVDFTSRPSPYTFLKRCAERTASGQNFHREEFTENFDTMVKRVLEPINQKLTDSGLPYSLQKSDLFVRDAKGIYKLVFKDHEVVI